MTNEMTTEIALHCMKSAICEEVCEECPMYGEVGTDHCEDDAHRLVIQALEEIQQYRAIGTVEDIIHSNAKALVEQVELEKYKAIGTIEEFKALKNKHIGKDNMVISSSDLMTILNSVSEELKQYKEVGTVEEFKALKEKSEPKKAKWIFDDFTAMFGNPYHCSNCDEEFGDTYYYCPNCGCNMYD